jgi:hypothetical protein
MKSAAYHMNYMKMTIHTNRDLYLAIAGLIEEQENTPRSLEEYLRSLWSLASELQALSGLSPTEFYELLSNAFSAPALSFQDSWRQRYSEDEDDLQGYLGWQARIRRQIVDLRELKERGRLKYKDKYFGINSPRGHRWYNFDPAGFLECAMAGTYGGWRPGDATGRIYAPGKVAVLNEEGKFEDRDPDTLPNPVYPIAQISWDRFQHFLLMGQTYE